MIESMQRFFNHWLNAPGAAGDTGLERRLELAAAALYVETMRADFVDHEKELPQLIRRLRESFALDENEARELFRLAQEKADTATSLYEFTALLNDSWSLEQKIEVVENMWRIAYADGEVDANELHLIRKVAALLYVPVREYAAARIRSRTDRDDV